MNKWYFLYCKRSEQQRAGVHLKRQGVDCYYPQVTVEKIIRGKRTSTLEPLFPNYMFVDFDPNNVSFTTVRSTRGVADFVRTGRTPVVVPFDLIKTLMVAEDSDSQRDQVNEAFLEGEPLSITDGQFKGAEAIFKESDGELRSILLVKFLSNQVEVSVDNTSLVKQ